MVQEGDTITALIDTANSAEDLIVSNMTMETIYMIVGRREKFDIIPFVFKSGQRPRTFPSSFFKKYHSFGIVRETRGAPGERIFTCYVYKVRDGAKVEIREHSSEPQIFEYIGTSAGEVPVEKEEV